jgi:FemAB-related protein (PEP-CTERM system-associated)
MPLDTLPSIFLETFMTSQIKIIPCGDADAARWDAFVNASPDASFYHRFAWRRLNEKSLGHRSFYLSAERDGQVLGVFPLVSVKSRLFGNILCSMPFVNYGGPCTADHDAASLLLDEVPTLTGALGADYAEIRTLKPLARDLPTSLHKISMTVQLAPDPETLWNAFSSKHRKNMRRVQKNDLRVVSGHLDQLAPFYQVLTESWRDHGTPIYSLEYFRDVLTAFPEHTRIFIVYHGTTPVAGAFVGYHGHTVEGLWLGTPSVHRQLQPSYVLYWEMIKDSCERGYKHFHLGRSTVDSGGEVFKEKWNAQAEQLYWSYYLPNNRPLPQLNVSNPRYQLAIRAWRKLPARVTTWIGPPIARCIP